MIKAEVIKFGKETTARIPNEQNDERRDEDAESKQSGTLSAKLKQHSKAGQSAVSDDRRSGGRPKVADNQGPVIKS